MNINYGEDCERKFSSSHHHDDLEPFSKPANPKNIKKSLLGRVDNNAE